MQVFLESRSALDNYLPPKSRHIQRAIPSSLGVHTGQASSPSLEVQGGDDETATEIFDNTLHNTLISTQLAKYPQPAIRRALAGSNGSGFPWQSQFSRLSGVNKEFNKRYRFLVVTISQQTSTFCRSDRALHLLIVIIEIKTLFDRWQICIFALHIIVRYDCKRFAIRSNENPEFMFSFVKCTKS